MNNTASGLIATTGATPLKVKYNWIAIFWVFVGLSLIISGIIAWECIHKGGSVAWSTRFGVWVQVACRF